MTIATANTKGGGVWKDLLVWIFRQSTCALFGGGDFWRCSMGDTRTWP